MPMMSEMQAEKSVYSNGNAVWWEPEGKQTVWPNHSREKCFRGWWVPCQHRQSTWRLELTGRS
uniref:Uncharacterized protein n=1 Tax=Arundo donax TaxID=35708 RepID=A0A0A9C5D8_ARUDO